MNHRPRSFNKPKLSAPIMAVYRLSDVAGDKTVLSRQIFFFFFFFAWSLEHGERGDCALNFSPVKLRTGGSFGTRRGTAQYSGYITAKGCIRLQRATHSGSMMPETPPGFHFFFPLAGRAMQMRESLSELPQSRRHLENWDLWGCLALSGVLRTL